MKEQIIKGFKGFEKGLKCRDFQYKINKEYEHDGDVKICSTGFHLCENPIHIFTYYKPNGKNIFHAVEGSGKISKEENKDSKIAVSKIKIGVEISLKTLISTGIKMIFERTKTTKDKIASGNSSTGAASGNSSTGAASGNSSTGAASGNYSTGAASGNSSTGAASGDSSTGAASGNYCKAVVSGSNCIALANGIDSKAKATKGNWLVLPEYVKDKNDVWQIKTVKTVKVDGKEIKADTFYTLKNGKFKIVE